MTPDTPTNPPEASRLAVHGDSLSTGTLYASITGRSFRPDEVAALRAMASDEFQATLAQQAAPVEAVKPDLRGIDTATAVEWHRELRCKSTDEFVRVADLPEIIRRALASQPPAAAEPVAVAAPMPELPELLSTVFWQSLTSWMLSRTPGPSSTLWNAAMNAYRELMHTYVRADRAARVAKEGASRG